jgi:hypothetical protein
MSLYGCWGPGSLMQFLALTWSLGALQGHFLKNPIIIYFLSSVVCCLGFRSHGYLNHRWGRLKGKFWRKLRPRGYILEHLVHLIVDVFVRVILGLPVSCFCPSQRADDKWNSSKVMGFIVHENPWKIMSLGEEINMWHSGWIGRLENEANT